MQVTVRMAGVCAAVAIALTGSAAVAPGVARADLPGVCGTLLGAGVSAASIGRTVVARGAGFVGLAISAGCFAKDVWDEADRLSRTPESYAERERLRVKYAGYEVGDFMRDFDCEPRTRAASNPDDINERRPTTWDCSRSPYAQID